MNMDFKPFLARNVINLENFFIVSKKIQVIFIEQPQMKANS